LQPEVSVSPVISRKIGKIRSLSFPDLNDKHLEVAKAVGIRPLEDREEAESMKEKLDWDLILWQQVNRES